MSRNKGFGVVLLAVCTLLMGCGSSQGDALIEETLILPEEVNYETAHASLQEYTKNGQGSLILEHPISAYLHCEEQGSRMKETLVSKGDVVSKGDPLVYFETEQYETEIQELKLQVQRTRQTLAAESQKMLAKINLAKSSTGWLSVNDAELASLQIRRQEVQYEQYVYDMNYWIDYYEDEIDRLEELAANNVLVAPYDGVIHAVVSYNPGDEIDMSKPVVTMYSQEMFLLATDDTDKLRYNMPVTVLTGTKKEQVEIPGRVVSAPDILPKEIIQDYVLITVDPEIKEEAFQRGITYQCQIQNLQDVLMVDSKAVEREEGKSFVYILEDDMVKKRFVKEGLSNIEGTWILDGLQGDETLILDY